MGHADARRCPSCAAAVRPDAPWCTQCFAAVGSAPAGAQAPSAVAVHPAGEPGDRRVRDRRAAETVAVPSAAVWPCSGCGTTNALADSACTCCGAGFLSALRSAEPPLLVLPLVGDLSAVAPVRRFALAVGVVLALLVALTLLGLLLG